ncbi:right-handed parallel beta-helix repeat-containing protein [Dyadobacter sp. CY312]|uniref:right-handed parallel beta-helix repeat-containing protein n=1 Tax=Dyadobacter sp. CY312 TaxID=2907303 RepID=UPI001F1A1A98|nr:right-handed parallel beta-helix repeat-containing protein [Dyadobacter sp. CY312]MCE7043860.1 right-handed parallel beta-helix repeat-containing protein [Dyadobacter sp. CY312]
MKSSLPLASLAKADLQNPARPQLKANLSPFGLTKSLRVQPSIKIIFATLFFLLLNVEVYAQVVLDNGASETNYTTLQAAINAASAGNTISVDANLTEGQITVNKKLTINGNNHTLNRASPGFGILIDSPDVTITNLTVTGATALGLTTSCGAHGLKLTNVTIQNGLKTAFNINGVDNAVLTNITATNNIGNGISISDCENLAIHGVTTSGNAFAGGFSAGIGIFSGGACAPTVGTGTTGVIIGGTVNIGEPFGIYQQGASITGVTLPADYTHFAGIGVNDRYYTKTLAASYTMAATFIANPTVATTVYVEELATGNHYVDDQIASAGVPGNYNMSIQAAINYLVAGKTVFVENGTFNEDVVVNKPLTLQGNTRNGSIIKGLLKDSSTPSVSSYTLVIDANDVTVKNLTVTRDYAGTQQGWFDSQKGYGLVIENKDRLTVDNVLVKDNRNGVYLHNTKGTIVRNSEIVANRTGFQVWGPLDNTEITNNIITGNFTHGIVFNFDQGVTSAPGMKINNNNISGNWYTQISFQRASATPSSNVGDLSTLDLTCNWYGATPTVTSGEVNLSAAGYTTQATSQFSGTAPATTLYIAGEEAAGKNYAPFLNSGTDSDLVSAGFQPQPNSCVYPVNNITHPKGFLTIQAAVNDAITVNGDEILINNGTYKENVTLPKQLKLTGESEAGVILDGTGLPTGTAIFINNGVTNVMINKLTIQNYTGSSGNTNAGIYANLSNNNLVVSYVTIKNNVNASGFYANGPVENVTIDHATVTNNGSGARGLVIWNGLKKNITITNSNLSNNSCCGIELQDGSATGVTITGNTIEGNDSAISAVGLTSGSGTTNANTISNNIITVKGRFGIEVKNPNGTGFSSGDGAVLINANTITYVGGITEARDLAGIAVHRRGVGPGNVDVPTGVRVSTNTVNSFVQASTSEGFGIVIEGTNHTVTNNILNGNDIGLQQQAGHLPYPGDGKQDDLADNYFGRGNSPITCGNTISGNTGTNTINTRNVGTSVGGGLVTNTNTTKTFCSIQAAISDATTLNGHVITLGDGTYQENVTVSKSVTIAGANNNANNVIITPATAGIGTGLSVTAPNVKLDYVTVTNFNYGVVIQNNANHLTIDHSKINNNIAVGIRVPTGSTNINNLTVTNSEVKNNNQGLVTSTNTSITNNIFDAITIQNSDFSDNKQKGIYMERASNLLIDGILMNASGTDNSYQFNNGIDLNLQHGTYANITIRNSTFTGSGLSGGVSPNLSPAGGPAAINIKARSDKSPTAAVNNVLLENNTISGSQNSIVIGSTLTGLTSVTIKKNNLSGSFVNKAIINYTNADVALLCNWHGTTLKSAIEATLQKYSGTFSLTTVSNSPTITTDTDETSCIAPVIPTEFWVNDNATTGDHYTTAIGNDANTGTQAAPFLTINKAISVASAGNTIWVDAGNYAENVDVNKSVKIYGSNKGLSPSGTRLTESIVVPATNDATGGSVFLLTGLLNGVEIEGFMIDGDNTTLSGGATITGIDVNAAEAISAYDGVSNTLLKNNIIQNLNYAGIDIYNYTNSGSATSGNIISNNKIDNILPIEAGIGIIIYNNAYTSITDNSITNVRVGIQTGNFSHADPGNSHVISQNSITALKRGIWHNLAYSNASNFEITNNTVEAISGTTAFDGIMISSLSGTVGATVENNNVTGSGTGTTGYQLWNNPTSNTITVKGGAVSQTENGIFANNYDGYPATGSNAESSAYIVDNVTINNSQKGAYVKDNGSNTNNATVKVTFKNATTINEPTGAAAILVEGNDAQVKTEPTASSLTVTLKAADAQSAVRVSNVLSGAGSAQYILNSGLSVNLNGNTSGQAITADANSIVDVQSNYSAPNKVVGGLNPILTNGQLWFTDGILSSGDGSIEFGPDATDIVSGIHAENTVSHILGSAKMVQRPVGTGTLNMLGANLPAGSDLGNTAIERITSSGTILPAVSAGSINARWIISTGTANGRDDVTFSFLSTFLNSQSTTTLYAYRYDGSAWESKSSALTITGPTAGLYTTSAFDIAAFSPWTLGSSASLPVVLTSFKAVKENNTTQLIWATTSESNSDHFDVQHSVNGKNWLSIGRREAMGDNAGLKNYSFNHTTPATGENLYRLKMIDRDGTFAYSSIESVNFGSNQMITLYPNPVSDRLQIGTQQWNNVSGVKLIDLNGRTVYSSAKGKLTNSIDVKSLASGTYLVEITHLNGQVSASKVVIVR